MGDLERACSGQTRWGSLYLTAQVHPVTAASVPANEMAFSEIEGSGVPSSLGARSENQGSGRTRS